MNKKTNLRSELEIFKDDMIAVRESIENLELILLKEKEKFEHLQYSFAHLIKLINHEMIKRLDDS